MDKQKRAEVLERVGKKALADLMSEISEKHWAAGWLDGLEYALWEMLQDGPRNYGMGVVSDSHIARLHEMSEAVDGWVMWQKDHGEVFVSLDEWRHEFDEWNKARKPKETP